MNAQHVDAVCTRHTKLNQGGVVGTGVTSINRRMNPESLAFNNKCNKFVIDSHQMMETYLVLLGALMCNCVHQKESRERDSGVTAQNDDQGNRG